MEYAPSRGEPTVFGLAPAADSIRSLEIPAFLVLPCNPLLQARCIVDPIEPSAGLVIDQLLALGPLGHHW